MKRNLLRIITFAALVVGVLAGCQDDIGKAAVEGGVGREGRRLKSEISVVPMQNDTPTKSLYGGDESVVNNWALLQFDGVTEKLVAMYYQESGANIGNIKVVAGHPYYWFAVANLGDVRSAFTVGTTVASYMTNWYATGINMSGASGLPMSWSSNTSVSFDKEQISSGARLEVEMTRMVAKYYIQLDKSELGDFTFSGTSGHQGASIMGPGSVKAFAESNAKDVAPATSSTDGFSSMDIARFYGGDAVVLYAAENMYGVIESIDTPAKKKASNVGDRRPTYVEIYGVASGRGYENVPLTYRFYLGRNATNDFDVIRNTVNTVTLKLTPEAILSAIAVANNDPDDPYYPDDPDIWKIEAQPAVDTRVLRFNDGIANGGTGSLSLTLGERTAEALVRTPADLAYQFKMDAALYSAGFRAYTDAAGTTEVDSGYGSDYVTVTGAPGALYFYAPTGISPTTGKVYVKTTDGRKSDELTLTAGRVLDHIELQFGSVASGTSMTVSSWGTRYNSPVGTERFNTAASALDSIFIQLRNASNVGPKFAVRIYAVYSDGTDALLSPGTGGWLQTTTIAATNTAAPNKYASNSETNYFWYYSTETTEGVTYRTFRMDYAGQGQQRFSYTEGGLTKYAYLNTKVHTGELTADPVSTNGRVAVPLNGSIDVKYYWVDNNESVIGDAAKVDVTAKTASHITIANGGTYLKYDGLVGGAARFSGKGVAGYAQANVGSSSDYGFINYKDIVEGFGDDRNKVRSGNLPTDAVQSNSGYHKYSRSYFSVVDTRVLDHITIVASRIYAPGVSTSSDETVNYKVYAYFEGDATPVDITTSSDLTVTPMTYYNSSYPYPQKWQDGSNFYMTTMRAVPAVSGEYLQTRYLKSSHNSTIMSNSSIPLITTNTDANTPYFTVSYTFGDKTCTDSVKPSLEDTRTVVALNVTPNPVSLYEGQSQQFIATAVYDTGDEVDVTTTATWNNDANSLMSNNGGGSYTGVTPGTTTVSATYNGVSGSASVTVLERTIQSFEVRMFNRAENKWDYRDQTVNLGSDQDWCILVHYEDDPYNPVVVTTGFELTTTDGNILSVSGTDSHAEAIGTVTVGATYKGKTSTNTVKVTVQSHEYSYALLVTDRSFPNSAEGYDAAVSNNNSTTDLDWDETQGFYAYYVRKDHGIFDQMTDVSGDASWTIDSDLTASNVGSWNEGSQIYTANNTSGSVVNGNLEAEYSGEGGVLYADKTISVAYYIEPQYRLVVTLDDSTIDIDETTQATATLYTSTDGGSTWDSGTDVTSSADFSSSAPGKATVASGGTVTGVDTGTAVISATYNGISSSDDPTVTVSGYRIGTIYNRFKRLEVRPKTATIAYGDNEDFNLWCVYEKARRTGGDSFDNWVEDEFEITNAIWSQNPGNNSSINASTGVLTNSNESGSTQEVTVTAAPGESRTWWTLTTAGSTPADNLTASATATLAPKGVTYTYKLVISANPTSLTTGGSTTLTATLYTSTNGGSTWDGGSDVTSSTTFSVVDGSATVSDNSATSTTAGTSEITGSYSGVTTVENVSVTWNNPAPTPSYRLVITASPTELEPGEYTSLTATLYTDPNGGTNWDSGTDVTSSTTFSVASGSATVNNSTKKALRGDEGTATFTGSYSVVSVSEVEPSETVTWAWSARTPVSLTITMDDLRQDLEQHGRPYGVVTYSDATTKTLSPDDFDGYEVIGNKSFSSVTYSGGDYVESTSFNLGQARIRGTYTENGVTVQSEWSTFMIYGLVFQAVYTRTVMPDSVIPFNNSKEIGFVVEYLNTFTNETTTVVEDPTNITRTGVPNTIDVSNSVTGVIRIIVSAGTPVGTYTVNCSKTINGTTMSTSFDIIVESSGYHVSVDIDL